ncbi:MAG TPA: 50S ribosomal protein L10 [bacterium]|nr:50S ribosomal protein L10 [bacterium]
MAKAQRVIRPEKQQEVESLKTKFGAAKGIVLADFTGVTVAEVSELRRKCRGAGVDYKVVKNSLAKIAARDAALEGLVDHFDGPIAIALSSVDAVAPARVLSDFVRTYQKMILKVGYFDGRIYSDAQIPEIASLPSREILVAQVIGAIEAPISQLIWCIESGLRDVISVIDQAGKKA